VNDAASRSVVVKFASIAGFHAGSMTRPSTPAAASMKSRSVAPGCTAGRDFLFPRARAGAGLRFLLRAFMRSALMVALHPLLEARSGNGCEQVASILRLRRKQHLLGRPLLHNAPGLHDDDTLAEEPHHVEVVGDEEVAYSE
jgi:hypothetical protein